MSSGDPIDSKPLPTSKLGKGEYDVVIFGLGIRECLLTLLLMRANKRVWDSQIPLFFRCSSCLESPLSSGIIPILIYWFVWIDKVMRRNFLNVSGKRNLLMRTMKHWVVPKTTTSTWFQKLLCHTVVWPRFWRKSAFLIRSISNTLISTLLSTEERRGSER